MEIKKRLGSRGGACLKRKEPTEVGVIQPGMPMQNGLTERFNKMYRAEVLNAWIFERLDQVRSITQEWMWHYNNELPHRSLLRLSPRVFLMKRGQLPAHYTASGTDFSTFQQADHHGSTEVVIFRNSRA